MSEEQNMDVNAKIICFEVACEWDAWNPQNKENVSIVAKSRHFTRSKLLDEGIYKETLPCWL